MKFLSRSLIVFVINTLFNISGYSQIDNQVSFDKICVTYHNVQGKSKLISMRFELPCNWEKNPLEVKRDSSLNFYLRVNDSLNSSIRFSLTVETVSSTSIDEVLRSKNNSLNAIIMPKSVLSEKRVNFNNNQWLEHLVYQNILAPNINFHVYAFYNYYLVDGKLITFEYSIGSASKDFAQSNFDLMKENFRSLLAKTTITPANNAEKLEETKIGVIYSNKEEVIVPPPTIASKTSPSTSSNKAKPISKILSKSRTEERVTKILEEKQPQSVDLQTLLENSFKIVGYKDGKVSKTGSGYIIKVYESQDQYSHLCVSNAHVIEDLDSIKLIFSDNSVYRVDSFLHSNHKADYSFFQYKSSKRRKGLLFLNAINDTFESDLGSEIVTISSPKGLTNSITSGIISAVRKSDGKTFFQMTAPISSGSSGGLVARKNGFPIGIIVSQFSEGQNINFAIPLKLALDELLSKGVVSKEFYSLSGKNYALNSMPSYYVENDEIISDIWASRNNKDEFYSKVMKVPNEDLFQTLLFLKAAECESRGNWAESFNTIFYAWNKYRSPVEVVSLLSTLSSFGRKIDNIPPFNMNTLRDYAQNDEILNIAYQYINGSFATLNKDFEKAYNYFSIIERYIEDFNKVKRDTTDFFDNAKVLLRDMIAAKTYVSIGYFFGSDNFKNYIKAASYFEKSIPYIEEESVKATYLSVAIATYFMGKESSKACALYHKNFTLLMMKGRKQDVDLFSQFCK